MKYHFVINWSEEEGWSIDCESLFTRFNKGKTLYIPNLDEWVFPERGDESGDKESELFEELGYIINQLNELNK
jgi:hypothetical protein